MGIKWEHSQFRKLTQYFVYDLYTSIINGKAVIVDFEPVPELRDSDQ